MNTDWILKIKALGFPRVGQLGFVVKDIETSLPNYSSFYNINTWFEPIYEEKVFQIGENEVDIDLRLLFAFSGKLQLELIQADDQGNFLYAQHMQKHGEGLHHLGFYISNFEQKLEMVRTLKIPVLLQGKFKTAGGGHARFAYLDTIGYCGVILEIIEVKLFGINLPQTEFFWNLGTLTGDGEKIRV